MAQALRTATIPAMGLFGVTELAEPDALVEVMGVAVLQARMSAALDLHLSDAERALYEQTRELAATELAAVADAGSGRARRRGAGAGGTVNRPLVVALARHGLLQRLFAGDQVKAIELCLIREALARSCTEAETLFALQGLGAYPILQSGREQSARSGSRGSPPGPRSRRSR